MTVKWWGVLLATAPFALAGCYGSKLVRGPITTEENAREIAGVREDLVEADGRLDKLEELSKEQIELLRTIRAEFAEGRVEMLGRIAALEERLGENSDRVERVETKLDRVRYRLGTTSGEPAAAAPAAEDTSAVVIDPKPLFDAAYLDLVRGSYRAALAGFEGYLQAYPNSALSDDARYWIGECYLAEGEPGEAATHFARIEQDYPDSDRIPSALLKLATCRLELGDPGDARKILTRLIDKYPDSVEAPLAKEKLKETG